MRDAKIAIKTLGKQYLVVLRKCALLNVCICLFGIMGFSSSVMAAVVQIDNDSDFRNAISNANTENAILTQDITMHTNMGKLQGRSAKRDFNLDGNNMDIDGNNITNNKMGIDAKSVTANIIFKNIGNFIIGVEGLNVNYTKSAHDFEASGNNNYAFLEGKGILKIQNSIFADNTISGKNSDLMKFRGITNITDSAFTNNEIGNGSALLSFDGDTIIKNSIWRISINSS